MRGGDGGQLPVAPEQQQQDADAHPQAHVAVVEQDLVPAVGGEVLGVLADRDLVAGRPAVQDHVADLHGREAFEQRRMGVAFDVGEGVVAAVDRHPLPGFDPGHDPGQHPAGEAQRRAPW